jgi:Fe-S cluster assembly protein SufD
MNAVTNSALSERIAQEHAAATAASGGGLPSSVVSAARRSRALEALRASGLPTTRDDNWKYANLRGLEKNSFRSVAVESRRKVAASDLPPAIAGYARYVFVDGAFAAELSATAAHAGVTVRSVASSAAPTGNAASDRGGSASAGAGLKSAALGAAGTGTAPTSAAPAIAAPAIAAAASAATRSGPAATAGGDDRFALLNDAFAVDGAVVHAPKGADCAACVEILFVATEVAQNAASYPRLELQVEANARVGLIERHISVGNDANFVNGAVQVNIGPGAFVDHYRLQQAGAHATWFDTLTASVDKDARYCVHFISVGALSARTTSRVQLIGQGAEAAVHVVSLADGQQVHDGFALIEHLGANTKSETSLRGIAAGRARVAFNSKVVVREHAKDTDSKQSLRGLLAGTQAEIDVRPQLEIYTDDVRCNHGATAGKLDDNMLFYLLSRGIEKEIAQQLLKWAFLEDVVSRIAVPELRKHIEQILAGQMKETAALKELL